MKLILSLSIPAMLGAICWLLSWAFAITPLRYNPYAHLNQTCFNIVFVLMIWIGPFTSVAAIILAQRAAFVRSKRIIIFGVNGIWIAISLIGFAIYWHGHEQTPLQ